MKLINDEKLLNEYIDKFDINSYFSTPDLRFRLIKFDKGNMITRSKSKLEYYLFIVSGSCKIYSLNAEGSIYSVAQSDGFWFCGDIEFATKEDSTFVTEAITDVYCVGLSVDECDEILHRDIKFLNFICRKLGNGYHQATLVDYSGRSLEDKLSNYLEAIAPNNEFNGVEKMVAVLKCSRRQLQRVIAKLCDEGSLEKTGKGSYRLKNGID